jgi:dihydropteroate synthase-like protein
MKVLVLTGQLAKNDVMKFVKESDVKCEVIDLPVRVAALMSPQLVVKKLTKKAVKGYDLILLPGMMSGDLNAIEKALGVKAFRGPVHAADLPVVLSKIGELKLSKVIPACNLVRRELEKRVENEIKRANENQLPLKRRGNFLIRKLAVGKDYPMRLMAEVSNVTWLSDDDVMKKIKGYVRSGADMVCLGMSVDRPNPNRVNKLIAQLRRSLRCPVAIDTPHEEEALAALASGVDILVGVKADNMKNFSHSPDRAIVVIPNGSGVLHPENAEDRVESLVKNVKMAKRVGFTKVIGDPILNPITLGLVESLVAYHKLSKLLPSVPLLFGVGNVTELLDADSPGSNAILAGMASELNVSILLTTEASDKTRSCVAELAIASKMMFMAKRRKSPPKDLGLDLLLTKDKRFVEEFYDDSVEKSKRTIVAKGRARVKSDRMGIFKIMLDREKGYIVALHFFDQAREPDIIIKGKSAVEAYQTIIREGLASNLLHAAYLGYELGKAETALRTGKAFVQDAPLFDDKRLINSRRR